MTRTALAIGGGVVIAMASVITLLAVKGEPVEEPAVPARAQRAAHPWVAKTLDDATARPSQAPVHAPTTTVPRPPPAPPAPAPPAQIDVYGSIGPSGWSSSAAEPSGLFDPKKPVVPPVVQLGSFGVKPAVAATATPGNLDKAIVRRYLRRNLQKIQYCYEKQLLVTPGIKGVVNVAFSIEDSGVVSKPTATGVDGNVASCIGSVVSSIQFPRPTGAGGVTITTAFTFRPT